MAGPPGEAGRLATLATHLGAAAAAPAAGAAATKAPLELCIVGLGVWGLNGYQHLNVAHPAVRVAVVVEPNAQRREAALQMFARSRPRGFASLDEALAAGARPAAAIIAAPHVLHHELAMAAIRAGMHVLIEKPMVTSAAQAREVVDAAKAAGVLCMVNNTANYQPQCAAAARMVEGGMLGAVEHVVCHMAGDQRDLYSGKMKVMTSTWADPKRAGGYGWGQLSHILSWVFRVSGLQPKEVYCLHGLSPIGVDYYTSASVRCTSGATIAVSAAATLPAQTKAKGKQIDVRMFGQGGCLTYCGRDMDRGSGELVVETHDGLRHTAPGGFMFEECTKPPGTVGWTDPSDKFPESLGSFIAACRGRAYFDGAPGEVGLRVVQTLDAMYRSARSGKPEPVA